MGNLIEEGRKTWESKKSRMTREDWMLVGQALMEGKKWCATHPGYGGDKGFGKWCAENGFDDIPRMDRADAMWLLSKDCQDLLYHNDTVNLFNHPRVIRAAFRAKKEAELGGKLAEAVSRHLVKHPGSTPNEIAEAVGVDPDLIRKRTWEWERRGLLKKETTDNGVTWSLGDGKPVEPSKGKSVEDLLIMDAARSGLGVEEHLLRKVAEDLYWLHLMLSRRLAGGSTSMPSTIPDEQAEMFSVWVKSLKSVSGRLGVFKADKSDGFRLNLKPYAAAPVGIKLGISYESDES